MNTDGEGGGILLGILCLAGGLALALWMGIVTESAAVFLGIVAAAHYAAYRGFEADGGLPEAKSPPWRYGKHD